MAARQNHRLGKYKGDRYHTQIMQNRIVPSPCRQHLAEKSIKKGMGVKEQCAFPLAMVVHLCTEKIAGSWSVCYNKTNDAFQLFLRYSTAKHPSHYVTGGMFDA